MVIAAGIAWHISMMWVLYADGLAYLAYGTAAVIGLRGFTAARGECDSLIRGQGLKGAQWVSSRRAPRYLHPSAVPPGQAELRPDNDHRARRELGARAASPHIGGVQLMMSFIDLIVVYKHIEQRCPVVGEQLFVRALRQRVRVPVPVFEPSNGWNSAHLARCGAFRRSSPF